MHCECDGNEASVSGYIISAFVLFRTDVVCRRLAAVSSSVCSSLDSFGAGRRESWPSSHTRSSLCEILGTTMTTTPALPTVSTAGDQSDDSSDEEELDPLHEESSVANVPYTSLLTRGRTIEQDREGRLQRCSAQPSSPSLRGSMGNNQSNGPSKRVLKKSARSFRMSFVLNAGDDGLDNLVKCISSESHDRGMLFMQATLALWEHRRKAAGLRRWKEILQASTDSLQLTKTMDINEEARKILLMMESSRTAMENAALSVTSPRAGNKHDDATLSAAKFSRGDLDLLVIWARQMQTKTFPLGVDDTSIRETMKYVRFRQYQDGEALFFEGEIGEIFYFLFHGTVAVFVGSSKSQLKDVQGTRRMGRIQGKPDLSQLGKRVFAYRTGEGFGETAMFTNDAIRTASAIAVGACEVCELPKEIYRRTLKKYHQQFFEQSQKINFVQRVSLFKDWQRHRLSTVADVIEKRKLAFGDQLVVEGSSVLTSCYFVLSGAIKLTKLIDLAPPPHSDDTNQSTRKKPRHRIQMNIELQTLGATEIVALEALIEPDTRATYSAVAASASVELYVLKEVDARSFMGSVQSSLYQHVRAMCRHEKQHRQSRYSTAKQTFQKQEALKKDVVLLQSQDNFAEDEQKEQFARKALEAQAEAALLATTSGASPLLCASAAPYLPHLRATKVLEFDRAPYVPMSPASRVDQEIMTAITSPRMLSTCAKNFIFENSHTLASDYPERLRLQFPSPPMTSRSAVERAVSLMSPTSPSPLNTTISPLHSARRRRPTSESRDDQRVLEQQMKRLYDTQMHCGADRKDLVLRPPPAKNAALSSTAGVNVVRPTALHSELKATQEMARRLVEEHLRKVSERQSEVVGQAPFLHFF